ncbi:hypothetical protein KIW84_053534 [Lathyrus oleraceus]|uniref:CCHC-type domain-containing protein n=1 Tax=Pisum sativum TaxID=3888 RepID=A0A9D4WTF2_PEA|nr:hypothetical protein KIW84_053534 [Pisum sativum]
MDHEDRSNRGRGRGVFRGGHDKGIGRQPTNKTVIECFKCHKLGHFQYECPDWEKKANCVELEEEELLLMSYVNIHQEKKEEIWFLDSDCNNHMTGNKEWFSKFEENFNQTVKLGNDTRMVVVAKGSIKVQINGIIQQDILEWKDEEDIVADRNEELGETSTHNLSNSPGNFSNSSISNNSSNKSNSLTVSPPNEPGSYDNESVEGRGMQGRREPIWMADYETGEGLSDDENLGAMMMVTENDPTTFGMEDNNVVKNPIVPGTKLHNDEGGVTVDETLFKQMVGSLMYLIVTRPDMITGVSLIRKFMAKPTMVHWLAV